MYLLIKDEGNNANITIINQETKSSVIIGKVTFELLSMLDEAGIKKGKENLRDAWRFEIPDEIGRKLASRAFILKKPIKDQTHKKNEQNKKIDAMDVLLGLANYC